MIQLTELRRPEVQSYAKEARTGKPAPRGSTRAAASRGILQPISADSPQVNGSAIRFPRFVSPCYMTLARPHQNLLIRAMNKDNAPNLASLLALSVLLLAVRPALAQSPPVLLVDVSTDSQVRLSWTNTATGFVLEQVDQLPAADQWSPVLQAPQLLGQQLSVVLSSSTGVRFFRLATQPGGLPPDPASVAPPIAQGVATLWRRRRAFCTRGQTRFKLAWPLARSKRNAPRSCAARSRSTTTLRFPV